MGGFNVLARRISFNIVILCIFSKVVSAAETSSNVYDAIINSVSNIALLVIVFVFCVSTLVYIFVKNRNRNVRKIIGEELYSKLYKFRKSENLFSKAVKGANQGIVVLLKINNIEFLKKLYEVNNVEDYVANIGRKLCKDLKSDYTFGRISISDFLIYSIEDKDESIFRAEILGIFNSMKEAISLNEMKIISNFNMGIAVMTGGSHIKKEIFRRAKLAMCFSQRQGSNKFSYYAAEIDEKFIQEDKIQKELNRALQQKEFELYYQPIINSSDGSVYGIEALIRWNHPDKGVLKPDYFLQEAEKNELVIDIGYWVIERAFRDYNTILNRFDIDKVNNIKLSINISPNQFADKYFVENLKNYIVKYNMTPELIYLEITKQVYMQETLRVNELFRDIKDIGCKIAFDDFGIEYSMLSKLQDLNFDVVKIDRKFILGIPDDKASVEIIKMLVSLTNITGKQLIAGGVDSEEQLEKLKEFGCHIIQGFYFSRALRLENLLNCIYARNIDNKDFIPYKITNGNGERQDNAKTKNELKKIVLYERFFNNLNAPATINRLIKRTGDDSDDIILIAANNIFLQEFCLPGDLLLGRGRKATYPGMDEFRMNEISKALGLNQVVRFPKFYHNRSGKTYDLTAFNLKDDKFALVFFDIAKNS